MSERYIEKERETVKRWRWIKVEEKSEGINLYTTAEWQIQRRWWSKVQDIAQTGSREVDKTTWASWTPDDVHARQIPSVLQRWRLEPSQRPSTTQLRSADLRDGIIPGDLPIASPRSLDVCVTSPKNSSDGWRRCRLRGAADPISRTVRLVYCTETFLWHFVMFAGGSLMVWLSSRNDVSIINCCSSYMRLIDLRWIGQSYEQF